MRGNILNYSEENDTGIITGPGDSRYKFSKVDWREGCPVISRVNVDFVAEGDRATEIYCTDTDALKDALGKIEAEKAIELERLERKQHFEAKKLSDAENEKIKASVYEEYKGKYSGFYRSSDSKLIKGVFGGLAHKFNFPAFSYMFRAAPFIVLVFALGKRDVDPGASSFLLFIVALTPLFYIYASKKWRVVDTKNSLTNSYIQLKGSDGKKSLESLSNIFKQKTTCTHCGSVNHHAVEKTEVIGSERFTSTVTKDQVSTHKNMDGKAYSTTTTPVQQIVNKVRERLLVTYKCTECAGLFSEQETRVRDA